MKLFQTYDRYFHKECFLSIQYRKLVMLVVVVVPVTSIYSVAVVLVGNIS